ncbi:O-antigen ligase family protein [Limnofasciculus baicalensis]|uniref:O-antigen ligase family protein n=1 Tax=Limnofasciculus baicalensis BBK-W-15 TaxID=2699891 RepID=A0AAE3GSQ5_9CYAN|nr:O-antigen ligase family protein [Limnofasciculus baicalensis]MCP2729564.1 O-antigen ligase family protein [Limnofasciculus baicalensis BBK-W-15]
MKWYQKLFHKHPDPKLQIYWNFAQLGVLIFPLIPSLGGVGLFLALAGVWQQKYRQIIRYPINKGFAIWSIWLIIISGFAYKPGEAFLGLANFLPFLIFFAAFSVLIQTTQQLRRLSWLLVIPSLPVVILGLGQIFWGWSTPTQLLGILGWVLESQGNPPGRMASVFIYANILAGYLVIVFTLGLGLWIEAISEFTAKSGNNLIIAVVTILKTRGLSQLLKFWTNKQKTIASSSHPLSSLSAGKIGFLTVTVIASAIALILTNSRNAWGIIIFACLAFALYQGWHWLVAGVVAIATAVLGAAFSPSPLREWLRIIVPAYFWARFTDQLYPDRPVALMRVTQWHFALSMTEQRPWIGWGLRNFTPLYEQQMNLWLGHPHNLLLMLTAETGIPATILLFSLVGWILAQGVMLVVKGLSQNCDGFILFTYLLTFGCCILFNSVDVSLFDLRVNTLGWFILSAICGIVYREGMAHK